MELGLPTQTFRDPVLEDRLRRILREYPAVRVIPEPYGRAALAADIEVAQAQPGQAPRDAAAKKADQKLAVEWLRKMATGELTGYEVKSAEPELRAALRSDDLADAAIDAVARFGSADAQLALVRVATFQVPQPRPQQIRAKAADAAIQHIQLHSSSRRPRSTRSPSSRTPSRTRPFAASSDAQGDTAYNAADFVNQLKGYRPPLVPALPKLPPKDPKDPKDQKIRKIRKTRKTPRKRSPTHENAQKPAELTSAGFCGPFQRKSCLGRRSGVNPAG